VPETITGRSVPFSFKASATAIIAAFAFSVSKMVSIMRISTFPSMSPFVCSLYAPYKSSKEAARYPGSFTSGDMEVVLLVGPIAPATNLGFAGFWAVNLSAAFLAISAETLFIS